MSRETQVHDVQRGIVDRITDGWAVIVVGDREQERVREDDLPRWREGGSMVRVRAAGLRVEILDVDDEATEQKRTEVRDRLDRLKDARSKRRFDESP